MPDAIITGTGFGCLEDTEKFLGTMVKNNEEFLTPTSFIQSTHNTVAGQIALLLKCHNYNFTYVHRGFSFESALIDAITQVDLGNFSNALAGGMDELTVSSYSIMGRFGFWKKGITDTLRLKDDKTRGTIAGEGSSFFFLENSKKPGSYAELKGVRTLFNPSGEDEIESTVKTFLRSKGLIPQDISAVISGFSGNPSTDNLYNTINRNLFQDATILGYKNLCGEYMTSSSFALWLGSMILKTGSIPECVIVKNAGIEQSNILIHNHFMGINHSFILIGRA
jgi:3-oxoacyl-(acyl-carrier-protein) synthase